MYFSLILATVDRTAELERFLRSLTRQTHRDLELIVVDQNPDDRLAPILASYRNRFPIKHIHSERGLSRARNVGLQHASGDVVAFPDDDCVYPPDLLSRVAGYFESHPDCDGLTGRAVDFDGVTPVWRFEDVAGEVNKRNVWRRGTSFTIFLSRNIVKIVGGFDTTLGVGSGTMWGSSEETDYLIRCLYARARVHFDPDLIVFHPKPAVTHDPKTVSRGYAYGRGMGRVLRMHGYPFSFVVMCLIRPLGGTVISMMSGRFKKALYHWAVFRGRLHGWYDRDPAR